MSQMYRDSSGRFISQRKYYRNIERRLSKNKKPEYEKPNYPWIAWVALGAFGVALIAIFI